MGKYTESRDGIERTTVRLPIRLTREQIIKAKQMAGARDQDWRTMLEGFASLTIEHEIYEWEPDHPTEKETDRG